MQKQIQFGSREKNIDTYKLAIRLFLWGVLVYRFVQNIWKFSRPVLPTLEHIFSGRDLLSCV